LARPEVPADQSLVGASSIPVGEEKDNANARRNPKIMGGQVGG